jgi:hypothetical protein
MKTLLACLFSSFIVAGVLAIYSVIENGVAIEVLGVMLIAFLYALAVSLIIGLPSHYVFKRLGRNRAGYYVTIGIVAGLAFTIAPLVTSRLSDPSLLKLTLTLAVAGVLAGITFHRVANA